MKKTVILTIVLALIAVSGSLRAELDSVNLFEQQVNPAFEDPNLSDWTLVGAGITIDSSTSSTGDSSVLFPAGWVPLVLGLSDQYGEEAGLADLLSAEADTDYFAGAWLKSDVPDAMYVYFSRYTAAGLEYPTPYIMTGDLATPEWVFYRTIINSGDTTFGLGFTFNCSAAYNADDIVIAKIVDPNSPHVLVWGDSVQAEKPLALRGYAEAGTTFALSTTTWSKVSGPGGVVFGDEYSVNTTATFDAPGSYTLQLEVVDSDENTILVTADYEVNATPEASRPVPGDAAAHIINGIDLAWTPGFGLDSQEVYFDAGAGAPTSLIATLSATDGDLTNIEIGGPLADNTTYSWQVVGYIGETDYPGPVWSFSTRVGLVYYWPLDGDLTEIVSGNDGVATGTVSYVEGVDGTVDGAISVTATDFVASINNLGITGAAERTVSCWFNVGDYEANRVPFNSGDTTGCGTLFEIYVGGTGFGNVIGGHFWCGGFDTLGAATKSYTAGEWVMATMVLDAGIISVYQNATLIAQAPFVLNTVDTPAFIGGGGWLGFDGQVDDVRIYDYALEEAEIIEVYLDMFPGYVCSDRPAYDFTDDCVVDLADFAAFALEWMNCGRFPASECP